MLEDAQIEFTRSKKTTHAEMATRLFAMSKQTVVNEIGQYYYTFLEKVEFYEFFARVADEFYHRSFSRVRSTSLQPRQRIALEPLEVKIYELLLNKFTRLHQQLKTSVRDVGGGYEKLRVGRASQALPEQQGSQRSLYEIASANKSEDGLSSVNEDQIKETAEPSTKKPNDDLYV